MSNFVSITTTIFTNAPTIVTTNADGTVSVMLQQRGMTTYAIGPLFVPVVMIRRFEHEGIS
jgi:hypothetical protein